MKDLILDDKTNLVLSSQDRLSHSFITGYPSSGIATYLCKLVAQDTGAQTPTILIDPYGDLKESVEKNLDEKSKSNILHIKVGSDSNKVSLNIFQNSKNSESKIAQTIVDLFYDLYDPNHTGIVGPRFEHAIRNAVITVLADDKPDFFKLSKVFVDKEYVKSLLPKIKDQSVKSYWLSQMEQTTDFHKSEILDYIVSKFGPFMSHEIISKVVNGDNALDLAQAVKEGKTVIFDLSEVVYDTQAYIVLGTLLLHFVESTMLTKDRQTKVALYVDEVQMMNMSKLQKLAIFAKRYGVTLTYITSRVSKLESLAYECSRFGTKISFRQLGQDSDNVQKMFVQSESGKMNTQTLKRFHAYVQTLHEGEIQQVVIIET